MSETMKAIARAVMLRGHLPLYGYSREELREMDDDDLEFITFYFDPDDPEYPRMAVRDDISPERVKELIGGSKLVPGDVY